MKFKGYTKRAVAALSLSLGLFTASAPSFADVSIGYSDWPGFVAWQVAIEKGWFKEAGVTAKFEWFDYSASMDAYAAGKIDGVLITNGDALVTGSAGAKSLMIMLTDYSNGNDMIIAKPGIKSIKDLKGKKVAVEQGLVEHLLLLNALKNSGMKESDVTIVNAKTNEMPQVLASGDVSAVGAWQPISGQAMKAVPGSRPIVTSADEPGLIYDGLAVNPASAKQKRADWLKVLKVWDRVVSYVNDPKTQADAVKIMSSKSGVTPEEYLPMLKGTKLLSLSDNKKVYKKATGFKSIYGSTTVANEFNKANGVYKDAQDVDSYIDASFINAK
ncbi:MAG: ABC transporter substrate-binding protein [Gallionellales bacterium 35-53-114]|jgi:NitT/TauT family transport system substrate-binding protein|nr:MAG: ABC transporter substrate-binding protein [Gallionellales bacterium 35-53-114]OYZ63937.1 MAG: ABC transporter substrate-binding protein [Gallionellales bacterium 24-53-125]OZB09234.1 MAG: ABC transporter substrate-binding protein [Gallionellales bacterium 39-52-133]HQS59166.1 ABC transporter substrate-binding protein [Gallionellaceae bacterium]HQS75902.1 ABC transporter substrate-binding protein [Gallionellaceae bacterium]